MGTRFTPWHGIATYTDIQGRQQLLLYSTVLQNHITAITYFSAQLIPKAINRLRIKVGWLRETSLSTPCTYTYACTLPSTYLVAAEAGRTAGLAGPPGRILWTKHKCG